MTASSRTGTQSIERAVVILKQLAARGKHGWRLSDLSVGCGLDKGTTHRILASLIRARLARQRDSDRRYLPGPLLAELSITSTALSRLQAASGASLNRIAKDSAGIAFFYLRSGDEFVCARRVGSTSLRALSIDVGTRRPLIMSAGGVAILIALPKEDAQRIAAHNLRQVERFGDARLGLFEEMFRNSMKSGFGINESRIVPGIHAYGVAVFDAQDRPVASLTVAGPAELFPQSRVARTVAALEQESARLTREAAPLLTEIGG